MIDGKCLEMRSRSRRVARISLVAYVTAASILTSAALCASRQRKPEEFRTAIKAQDRGDWNASISLMRQALESQAEDGERVRIYGTRYQRYLPHFYVGLALYKQKDCAGAVKEWERCLSTGAVQVTEEHKLLLAYRSDCQNRLSRSGN
jgi:hypothetical protein